MRYDNALHSFFPEVAIEVGVPAAVIHRNIVFWIAHNEDNGTHQHDGKTWTYNSVEAFSKQFPYLSKKQIRTCLTKLVDAGFIGVGNYNQSPYDRTRWYCQLRNYDLPVRANERDQKGEPIPDSKPDSKPDNPPTPKGADLFSEDAYPQKTNNIEVEFDEWWKNEYPERTRSHSRKRALDVYKRKRRTASKDDIWNATLAYFNELQENDTPGEYVKMATTFLNDEPWRN